MNLEIDVVDGRVTVDGVAVWPADGLDAAALEKRSVCYLDLAAKLVIAEDAGRGPTAFVLFDEEEFPDSILTTRMAISTFKGPGYGHTGIQTRGVDDSGY